jgi:microcystin-dependent protein
MARQRFDTAPQFNVSEDSVVIQQVAGSTAPLLELKDHTGSSLMTVSNTGAMTTNSSTTFVDVTISGNLTVSGNTVTFDTETMVVEDKNIILGNTLVPSNTTADGGGITISAGVGGNKTFNFINLTSSWTSSEHIDLASNKSYKVNNVDVMCPVGMVVPYAGNSAPSGWLLCSNVAVSRTTYSALFAVIGTTYGSGDGITTFNLPDLRGRVIAGRDDMGGFSAMRITSANSGIIGTTLGASGGSELLHQHQHNNTITNNAVNSGNDNTDHTHSGTTGNDNTDHSHAVQGSFDDNGTAGARSYYSRAGGGSTVVAANQYQTGGRSAFHQHAFTSGGRSSFHQHSVTSNVTITNSNTGSGSSQNIQPSMVLNYIIKH